MSKCYFDESEGMAQGIRVVLNDSGQVVIEQYDTVDGKATDTVVLFAVGEAQAVADAITDATNDYVFQQQQQREVERLRRLVSGAGLPGGY